MSETSSSEWDEIVGGLVALRSPLTSGTDESARAHAEGLVRRFLGDREVTPESLEQVVGGLVALRSPLVSGSDEAARAHVEGLLRSLVR